MKTLVITGASGLGKTYLGDQLMKQYPTLFDQAKVFTNRAPRTNETPTDRIFISTAEFNKRAKNKEFTIAGEFGGNMYGFTKEAIYPRGNMHILVNIWPALLPDFLNLKDVVIVALQASPKDLTMLEKRMLARGDSPATIQTRKKLIVNDIEIVNQYIDLLQINGAVFKIVNDDTIHTTVLPWVKEQLNL